MQPRTAVDELESTGDVLLGSFEGAESPSLVLLGLLLGLGGLSLGLGGLLLGRGEVLDFGSEHREGAFRLGLIGFVRFVG